MIKGRLSREPGGQGVAGAKIKATANMGGSAKETTTDEQGAFVFADLANAGYSVTAPEYRVSGYADLGSKNEAEVILKIGSAGLLATVMRRDKPEAGASFSISSSSNGNFLSLIHI